MTSETHIIEWEGVTIQVRYNPEQWGITSHIELETLKPVRAAASYYRNGLSLALRARGNRGSNRAHRLRLCACVARTRGKTPRMARGATEGRARRTVLIVYAPKNSASQESCEALRPFAFFYCRSARISRFSLNSTQFEKRISMEGFLHGDNRDSFPKAERKLLRWIHDGRLK